MNDMSLLFSMKRKTGTLRDSCHGVKTVRGTRVFLDCPSVGSVCLLDDIQQIVISFADGIDPFNYKMIAYDQYGENRMTGNQRRVK